MSTPKPLDLEALKGHGLDKPLHADRLVYTLMTDWDRGGKPFQKNRVACWMDYDKTVLDNARASTEALIAAAPAMLAELERWREVGRKARSLVALFHLTADSESRLDIRLESCYAALAALLPDTTNQGDTDES